MAVADLVKRFIELDQVVRRRVFRAITGGVEEINIDLERGVAQEPQQLGFGDDFGGHQVEEEDSQGADVLAVRAVITHDKDALLFENLCCRQVIGDLDRHGVPPSMITSRSWGQTA